VGAARAAGPPQRSPRRLGPTLGLLVGLHAYIALAGLGAWAREGDAGVLLGAATLLLSLSALLALGALVGSFLRLGRPGPPEGP
jgi:hypothetical protein